MMSHNSQDMRLQQTNLHENMKKASQYLTKMQHRCIACDKLMQPTNGERSMVLLQRHCFFKKNMIEIIHSASFSPASNCDWSCFPLRAPSSSSSLLSKALKPSRLQALFTAPFKTFEALEALQAPSKLFKPLQSPWSLFKPLRPFKTSSPWRKTSSPSKGSLKEFWSPSSFEDLWRRLQGDFEGLKAFKRIFHVLWTQNNGS